MWGQGVGVHPRADADRVVNNSSAPVELPLGLTFTMHSLMYIQSYCLQIRLLRQHDTFTPTFLKDANQHMRLAFGGYLGRNLSGYIHNAELFRRE